MARMLFFAGDMSLVAYNKQVYTLMRLTLPPSNLPCSTWLSRLDSNQQTICENPASLTDSPKKAEVLGWADNPHSIHQTRHFLSGTCSVAHPNPHGNGTLQPMKPYRAPFPHSRKQIQQTHGVELHVGCKPLSIPQTTNPDNSTSRPVSSKQNPSMSRLQK